MLVRFNVGNFLSFKKIQEFSMLKGSPKNKNSHIYEVDSLKLLKFAAVFGANASGKSNLVNSIGFAQSVIINESNFLAKQNPFKLIPEYSNKPSYFEFEIIIDDKNYSYGFEILLSENKFISEWLIQLMPKGKDKIIFMRDIEKNLFSTFSADIKSEDSRNKLSVYFDVSKKDTDILFLSEMNRSKDNIYKKKSELSIFQKVYRWFNYQLDVNFPDQPISGYTYFGNKENKDEICRVIRSLGTGITDYKEIPSSMEEIKKVISKRNYDNLGNIVDMMIKSNVDKSAKTTFGIFSEGTYFIISLGENSEAIISRIVFNHGNEIPFSFSEESDGTTRILDLLLILFTEKDKVFIIDEIDRSLHPQLTYKFIEEFLHLAENRNVQLVVTSHESRLLDFDLLRQDEIWIIDKQKDGASVIYSLDEFNVRFDKKVDKAYLEGRYGGTPVFNTIFPIKEFD